LTELRKTLTMPLSPLGGLVMRIVIALTMALLTLFISSANAADVHPAPNHPVKQVAIPWALATTPFSGGMPHAGYQVLGQPQTTWGEIQDQRGDCRFVTGYLTLTDQGQWEWYADAHSSDSNDTYSITFYFYDSAGNKLFTISSDVSMPEEGHIYEWSDEGTFNRGYYYDIVSVRYSTSC
jgi:hypothetical protein